MMQETSGAAVLRQKALQSSAEALLAARCGLTFPVWQEISARARGLQGDAFDLAIGEGIISERDFVVALAELTGLAAAFETLPPVRPAPGEKTRSEEAMAFRSYTAAADDGSRVRVIAPNGALAGMLLRQHRERKLPPIRLTTRQCLLDALVHADETRIARRAALTLPERHSARHPATGKAASWPIRLMLMAGLTVLLALAMLFPIHAIILPPLVLAPVFIIAGLSILTATFESAAPPLATPPVHTAQLPHYSILVPLFREANIVPALVTRLSALIYPRERIEVFFLVEAEDLETAAALRQADLAPWMLVLAVPEGEPRTKPRALNAALPFASGDLIVVFDAEDTPEPDQLLRAAALFRALPQDVACVQARLAITNVRDGFLTRRFAIDYASLFDCVKAGMARAQWPVPLGGSSNHFRTAVLRQVGGWDAWNVTEDADLGLRLARFGWRVEDLRSTTWEEAPNTLSDWMNQRTRWMKGWLQTFAVHSRFLRQWLDNLGLFRTVITAATGIAVLLGALLYPVFLGAIGFRLLHPTPLGSGSALLTIADSMLVLALVVAVLVEFIPAILAIRRRKALFLLPYVLLAPITHLLVSFAIWRAIVDLIRRPFHWHKTNHGQARCEGGLSSLGDGGPGNSTMPEQHDKGA